MESNILKEYLFIELFKVYKPSHLCGFSKECNSKRKEGIGVKIGVGGSQLHKAL